MSLNQQTVPNSLQTIDDGWRYIRNNLTLFYLSLIMPGGYAFSQIITLRRIELFYNSQFETGRYDSKGFYKYFYNICKPACDIATKFVDINTKDIILVAEHPDDEFRLWYMQKDLHQYLKETNFAKLLNDLEIMYPKYGHVVLKKDYREQQWKNVPVINLRTDPAAPTMEDSSFVYELHQLSRKEILDMPWDRDAVQDLFNRYPAEARFMIYECYDMNMQVADKPKWHRSFRAEFLNTRTATGNIARTPEADINFRQTYLPGVVLYQDDIEKLPYRELKWEHIPGRWLGQGFVEYLFDNQIRMNELENVKAKAIFWTGLHVFQTKDDTVAKNLLTDVENGDVLRVVSEVTPVNVEERNLAYYSAEEQRWDLNTERKTFSFDISRGENLPSHTPLGVANLSAQMVTSYFDIKRDNLGIFLRQLFLEDILPSFESAARVEHMLKLSTSDNEMTALHEAIANKEVSGAIFEYIKKNNKLPDSNEIASERQKFIQNLKKHKHIFVDIAKDFYKDVEYSMDIITTGEQMEVSAQLQSLQQVMQIASSNPAVLQDPALRSILFKMMELSGLSPMELNMLEQKVNQQQQAQVQQQQQQGQGQPAQQQQAINPNQLPPGAQAGKPNSQLGKAGPQAFKQRT